MQLLEENPYIGYMINAKMIDKTASALQEEYPGLGRHSATVFAVRHIEKNGNLFTSSMQGISKFFRSAADDALSSARKSGTLGDDAGKVVTTKADDASKNVAAQTGVAPAGTTQGVQHPVGTNTAPQGINATPMDQKVRFEFGEAAKPSMGQRFDAFKFNTMNRAAEHPAMAAGAGVAAVGGTGAAGGAMLS